MLDNAIERESSYVRKKSTIVEAENTFKYAMELNCIGGELPTFPDDRWDKVKAKTFENIKAAVKAKLKVNTKEKQAEKSSSLAVQSEFIKFSNQEQVDPEWKGFIYNQKRHNEILA